MKILYVCTWPDTLTDFDPKKSWSTCFGAKTLYLKGIQIEWHTHRRDTILYKICKWLPQADQIFAQLSCIKKARKYDIIYIGFDMHLLPLGLAKWCGLLATPVFIVSHFIYNTRFSKNILKKLFTIIERKIVYRNIEKISFASPSLLSLAQQDYNMPNRHHSSCFWGANTHYYNPALFQEPARRDIYIGVGQTNRDYDTLIKAFTAMEKSRCEIYTKSSQKGGGIPHNVTYINLMAGLTLNAAYKLLREKYYHCKAVLIPIKTINDVPNGATVLVEAIAMGRPVIITKAETNFIDVEKEGVGMSVEPGDVQGWIKAISYLENHPEELEAMSSRAYRLARKYYNDDNFTRNIYLHMANLLRRELTA
ncbi:glycosyltransferase [uncultured Alistipes sp.]|uniref:glycosyltransferase n=1 Tax=uncultured Alistipes sp. TaxID=538949 RepID=UPI0025FD3DA4|nr:glycosyltransferase [uncultured Alistipes sp.]